MSILLKKWYFVGLFPVVAPGTRLDLARQRNPIRADAWVLAVQARCMTGTVSTAVDD
jgi:hypothetical protein